MTPEQEIEQAKEYLTRLLRVVYPDIHPLDDLLGLISQIDNGFAVPLIEAQWPRGFVARIRQRLNKLGGKLWTR